MLIGPQPFPIVLHFQTIPGYITAVVPMTTGSKNSQFCISYIFMGTEFEGLKIYGYFSMVFPPFLQRGKTFVTLVFFLLVKEIFKEEMSF